MGILGGDDIAAMLDDIAAAGGAVEVILGSITANGLLDKEAVELLGIDFPGITAAEEIVHVAADDFPTAASGQAVTVDGTSYKIMKVLPYGDGAMLRLVLTSP